MNAAQRVAAICHAINGMALHPHPGVPDEDWRLWLLQDGLEHIPDARVCPECGSRLTKRNGRYGPFWGCESYPSCKHTGRA
jgi:hypothetical protein